MTRAERGHHPQRHRGFRFDHTGTHLGYARDHFLLHSHCGGAPDFGLGLGNEFVGLGLFGLKFGAHVSAYVHIGDVELEWDDESRA